MYKIAYAFREVYRNSINKTTQTQRRLSLLA